jgi:hypothetical protein
MELFTATGKLKKFFDKRSSMCSPRVTRHKGLKSWIVAAVKNIDTLMLTRVCQELEYRIDVCRVTRGAHIENR